jgi:hypothetical protein
MPLSREEFADIARRALVDASQVSVAEYDSERFSFKLPEGPPGKTRMVATFETVEAVPGPLAPEPGFSPPRYRVDWFPSDAQFREMQEAMKAVGFPYTPRG